MLPVHEERSQICFYDSRTQKTLVTLYGMVHILGILALARLVPLLMMEMGKFVILRNA